MPTITVPIEPASIGRLRSKFPAMIEQVINHAAIRARAIMVEETPVGPTGRLSTDIQVIVTKSGLQLKWNAPYAKAVDEGVGPHVMTAPTSGGKDAYRFNIGGAMVFAKKINHPGFYKRQYSRLAGMRVREMLQEELTLALEGMIP